MRNLKIFFLGMTALVLSAGIAYAKSGSSSDGIWGDCHMHDQMMVLGLIGSRTQADINASNENYRKIGSLLADFNFWIDDARSEGENKLFYKKLQAKYPKFSWHKYTHRLMFHWGYDWGDPLGHSALRKAFFNLNSGQTPKISGKQEKMFESFISDIQKEQQRREKMMTDAVDGFFNAGGSRDFDHAVGAIIYYTHLLGDHIEHSNSHTEEAVLSAAQIMDKIGTEVERLAPNRTMRAKADREYKAFHAEWKRLGGTRMNDPALAQGIVDVLSSRLPPILEKIWGETFRQAGLVFVAREDLATKVKNSFFSGDGENSPLRIFNFQGARKDDDGGKE